MNLFDNEMNSAYVADEKYHGNESCYGCVNKMCDGLCELDIENGCLDSNGDRLKFQLKECIHQDGKSYMKLNKH